MFDIVKEWATEFPSADDTLRKLQRDKDAVDEADTKAAVRRFIAGIKDVVAENTTEATAPTGKLAILEMGMGVLLHIAAEASGASKPLTDKISLLQTKLRNAEASLADVSSSASSVSQNTDALRKAYQKETALRAAAETKIEDFEDQIVELTSINESYERKMRSLKDKYTSERNQIEEELAEMAKSTETHRIKTQSAMNELMEKKILETTATLTEKSKRAIQGGEAIWKMKLKNAQDDILAVERRLSKAKLAIESAHKAEVHAQNTLAKERVELEGQRDKLKEELFVAQQTIVELTERSEKDQRLLKKAKTKVRKSNESASTDSERQRIEIDSLQLLLEEANSNVEKLKSELKETVIELGSTKAKVEEQISKNVELKQSLTEVQEELQLTQTALSMESADLKESQAMLDRAKAAHKVADDEIISLKDFLSAAAKARDEAREDLKRERDLLAAAKQTISESETLVEVAAEMKEKFDGVANELLQVSGELKGTQSELEDTKELFEKTQEHAVQLQNELSEAQQHLERVKHQMSGVETLKSSLAVAYQDLEGCKNKFNDAITSFNTSTAAVSSLHLFEF
eukprot:m.181141 g.181141  ORF g.181141 m.181141 type:complete len:576 (-) comp32054_c0_seq1:67-1794(-)